MWYVNLNQDFIIDQDAYGFILTMWYVNVSTAISTDNNLSLFYINYVVCKFSWCW